MNYDPNRKLSKAEKEAYLFLMSVPLYVIAHIIYMIVTTPQ
jgi:hypothetical protein